jgi:hypothetical protein
MEIAENKIRQYLLGNLSEEEAEKIDLRIISDKNFEELLYFAEESLMEDYLEKTLSPSDIKLFHENFLVSPERKNELKHLSLLKSHTQNKPEQSEEPVSQSIISSDNFFQKLKVFFGLNIPLVAALSVLIVSGLLIGVFLYDRSENELVRLAQTELSNVSEYKDLSNLSLISGTFRDAPGGGGLKKEALTDNTFFRLALPSGNFSEVFFNIKISREQKAVATLEHIRPYDNQNGQELRLLLPSSLLEKGDYKIEAAPENATEAPIVYSFTVR